MHIKTTSSEMNSDIRDACQHTEQHPPAQRKVPER